MFEDELDHPKVRPFTREIGAELGLDPVFVDFVLRRDKPSCFACWCEPAERGWAAWVPDEWEVAYPVWTTNASPTLLVRSGARLAFVKGHHDSDDIDPIARTVQGLLADLFITLWESEHEDDELVAAAAACGFRHLPDVLEFECLHDRDPDFEAVRERFVESIDARTSSPT